MKTNIFVAFIRMIILCIFFLCLGTYIYSDPHSFPDEIYFKTHKMSFNRRFFYYLDNGKIWIKSNHLETGIRSEWELFGKNGLPYDYKNNKSLSINYVKEICCDGNILAAISPDKKVYQTIEALNDMNKQKWMEKWGFPFGNGPGLHLPDHYKDWVISYGDPKEHHYYNDSNNNKIYHFVTHLFVLGENGQDIYYADPWTPHDFGYQYTGPLKGRFIAESMSVSGSTLFLINKFGDMYTRQIDFDIQGSNPLNFYTYYPQKQRDGIYDHDLLRSITIPPWQKQPKIDGNITRKITIFSNGKGSYARVLRVEGMDHQGNYGYFEKSLTDNYWRFVTLPNTAKPDTFLENTIEDSTSKSLGEIVTFTYEGYLDNKKKHKMIIEEYKIDYSPHILKIYIQDKEWVELKLYSRHNIRFATRDNPGMDGKYYTYTGAIEIIPDIPASFQAKKVLRTYLDYSPHSTIYINIAINMKESKIIMKRKDGKQPSPLWELHNTK